MIGWSTPTCRERRRVDHDAEANRRPGLAPVQPIVSQHLDLQTQQTHERARAWRHHAAGDVEASSAHFEIEAGQERHKHGMTGPLIGARDCHPANIDHLASGFHDQPAGLLGGERTGRQHETARRDCVFTIPPEQLYRSDVVVVALAVVETAIRIVGPAVVDDGLVAEAICCIPGGVSVSKCEAIPGAGENSLSERVKRNWSLGRVAHLAILVDRTRASALTE